MPMAVCTKFKRPKGFGEMTAIFTGKKLPGLMRLINAKRCVTMHSVEIINCAISETLPSYTKAICCKVNKFDAKLLTLYIQPSSLSALYRGLI